MPLNCGQVDFLDGGTIRQATITSSTVQGSVINGSVLDSSQLTNTTTVDEKTAQTIADAIAGLDTEKLRALGAAIAAALPAPKPITGPEVTSDGTLPTDVLGGRTSLLGTPAGWLDWRGVVIPAYKPEA